MGAFADSAYEYMLKQYLLTGRTDIKARDLCKPLSLAKPSHLLNTTHHADIDSANAIISTLIYLDPTRGLLYVTDTDGSDATPSHTFEHLSCFLPGVLALGAHTLPDSAFSSPPPPTERPTLLDEAELRRHDWRVLHALAAEGLAETCYLLYADQPTGLAPDEVVIKIGGDARYGLAKDGKWLEGGGRRWIDEVEAWRVASAGSGTWKGRRLPPGVGEDTKPVVHTELQRTQGTGRGRDYAARKMAYLLRPEVRTSPLEPYRSLIS